MKTVTGNGPATARVFIVFDYPSGDELALGRAGEGSVGRFMAALFKDASGSAGYDFKYADCYRTCFVKTELKYSRKKKLFQAHLAAARQAYFPDTFERVLAQEIQDINPNVIVPAGELALNFIAGERNIYKFRGSVLPLHENVKSLLPKIDKHIKVIPIIHPRDIWKKSQHRVYTEFDCARVIKRRNDLAPIQDDSLVWICRTANAFNNWWARAMYGEFLTLDIETFLGFITCISFCHDGHEAISIPLVGKESHIERAMLLRCISQVLFAKIPKVNQNIKYDHSLVERWGWDLSNVSGDTMLLGHTIYPELPKGLDFYTSIYTDSPYYKDEGKEFNPKLLNFEKHLLYNAKDSLNAWRVYKGQQKDAQELGVWNLYTNKVMKTYHIYKKMDDRGICVDEARRSTLRMKYSTMLNTYTASLYDMLGEKQPSEHDSRFYNSPKRCIKLVYEDMKLPKRYGKTENEEGQKSLSTDEETLEEHILNHCNTPSQKEILTTLLWCRKLKKILNYINVIAHPDGRLRTSYSLEGTKTGRTSTRESLDYHYFWDRKKSCWSKKEMGVALQTFPKHGFELIHADGSKAKIGKDLRSMLVPSEGYSFVEGDFSQSQARIVCVLADDYDTLEIMNKKDFKRNKYGIKDDLHTLTAMLVLNKLFDDVTEEDRQDSGKKPRHAGNFDMTAFRLSLMAHIPVLEAQRILERFHAAAPKIREVFHATIRNIVTNKRMLETAAGRIRQFFGRLDDTVFKDAFAHLPQAIETDHMKWDVMIPLSECMSERNIDGFFLGESHDSLLSEVRTEQVPDYCYWFKHFAEQPILFDKGSIVRPNPLVIPVEIKISHSNWYELVNYAEAKAA